MAGAFGIFPRRGVLRGVPRVLDDAARLAAIGGHWRHGLWLLFQRPFVPGFMRAGIR